MEIKSYNKKYIEGKHKLQNFSIENSNNSTLEIDSIHKIPKEIYCNENSKSKSQIHFKKEKEDEKEKAKNVKYFIFTCKDCDFDIPEILGLDNKEVFIYRNIGNIIKEKDENFLMALKYAIEKYQIKYFLIIGHFICKSFNEAIYPKNKTKMNKWLKNIRYIAINSGNSESKKDMERYERNYSEINIKVQIRRLGQCDILQEYFSNGNKVYIVGLTLNGKNGELNEIEIFHS
jgi:carbonic anhydrase